MKVYFVRHGESTGNAGTSHNSTDATELSEAGKQEANIVRERLADVAFNTIYCSPMVRARQTAICINQDRQKEIIYLAELKEVPYPSEVLGKQRDDPDVAKVWQDISEHRSDITWHYSDEENWHDRVVRARRALQTILQQDVDRVLVVAHNGIIKVMTMVMMFGGDVSLKQYDTFWGFTKLDTTGITLCEYDRSTKKWKLLSWNDHAHLEKNL